jgi:hypothetical protein
MFTVTASLLICGSLMGCDRHPQTETPAPAPVAAVAPVCNCPQQAAAAAPVVERHRHRWHHRHWHGGNISHEALWSDHETSSSSYPPADESDYAGSSEASGSDDRMAGAPIPPPPPGIAQGGVWTDGYGRGHYTEDAQQADDGDVAELTGKDKNRRLAPYHGFNSNCDRR